MKNLYWDEIRAHAAKAQDDDALASMSPHYAVNMNPRRFEIRQGIIEVAAVGTGFLLLRRDVFDTLRERFPELHYENDVRGYDNDATKDNFWLFFDTMHDPETGRYLSEDYAFCKRWRMTGGRVHCDIESKLTHFGNFAFSGSLLRKMQATRGSS